MSTSDPEGVRPDPDDQQHGSEDTGSSTSLPSGAGPQADGEQSDISSGGGTSS